MDSVNISKDRSVGLYFPPSTFTACVTGANNFDESFFQRVNQELIDLNYVTSNVFTEHYMEDNKRILKSFGYLYSNSEYGIVIVRKGFEKNFLLDEWGSRDNEYFGGYSEQILKAIGVPESIYSTNDEWIIGDYVANNLLDKLAEHLLTSFQTYDVICGEGQFEFEGCTIVISWL